MKTASAFRKLAFAVALTASPAVLAQSASDGVSALLQGCAGIEDQNRRLECFDAAARAIERRSDDDTAPRGSTSSAARADARSNAAGAARSSRSVGSAADARAAAPEARGRSAEPRPNEGSGAGDPTERPSVVIDAGGGGGDPDRGSDGEVHVTVVDVNTAIPNRAVFITSDGTQFVQTTGRSRLNLPKVPFQARLREGFSGSRFLVPAGTRGGIRVMERNDR